MLVATVFLVIFRRSHQRKTARFILEKQCDCFYSFATGSSSNSSTSDHCFTQKVRPSFGIF